MYLIKPILLTLLLTSCTTGLYHKEVKRSPQSIFDCLKHFRIFSKKDISKNELSGLTNTTGVEVELFTPQDIGQEEAANLVLNYIQKNVDESAFLAKDNSYAIDSYDYKIISNEGKRQKIWSIPYEPDLYNYSTQKSIGIELTSNILKTKEDYLIYDGDDEVIIDWLENNKIEATLLPFSLTKTIENGAYLKDDNIITTIDNNDIIMPTKNLALEGKHNIKNAMAASTVSHLLKIRKQTIRESLENFHGVEHRLEQVLKINKVQYINDSKATNVNATYYALESMEAPTVWIVGGTDKGNDYTELFSFVNEKVKAIICLGIDNEKLMENFGGMVDIIVETQFMKEAVKIAYKIAEGGDNVLLSPACASFDLFENYEDRGRQFKDAVRNL